MGSYHISERGQSSEVCIPTMWHSLVLLQAGSSVMNIIQFLASGGSHLDGEGGHGNRLLQWGCFVCSARGDLEGMCIQRRNIYPDCQGGLPRGGDVCTEAQRMSRS